MKRILVLCTRNSARSQMGEGLFRHEGRGAYQVASAGTTPSSVRTEAIAVMKEIGIDISDHRSKAVGEFGGQSFDYVITVCDNARDNCPVFPAGAQRIHWSLEDPAAVHGGKEKRLAAFRRVRDQLNERVKSFYRAQGATVQGLSSHGPMPTHEAIAEHAYELYVARGLTPDHDVDDWLQAERELCAGGEER
jgi:arsenate reductase